MQKAEGRGQRGAHLTPMRGALPLRYMSATVPTSLRLAPADKRLLSRAARQRGLSLQKYLVDAGKREAAAPSSALGRELEKLAIDAMAVVAVGRIRDRQDRDWTEAEIVAEVNAARR